MKDRRAAGHTAKPQGLYLQRVEYPEELLQPLVDVEK